MKNNFIAAICVLLVSCGGNNQSKQTETVKTYSLDEQAHRGGRGLMPENTIPAMLDAIDRDVTTLELDLQITKDKQVIVSHDPYFNEKITTTPEGKHLTKEESRAAILYNMTYGEIKKYDVGIKENPDFPEQKKMEAVKPLLSELVAASETHAKEKGKSMYYNIEIKSSEKKETEKQHPPVEEFVDLAMAVIKDGGIAERTIVQSFDIRALQILHKKYPEMMTSYLVDKKVKGTLDEQFEALGFIPHTYSPHQDLVTPELIKECHDKNVKVVSWSVNKLETMQKEYDWGIDGIITDYPNLFEELRKAN